MDQKLVGRYIRKKRKELGLSQQELGRRIYVEPQAISKWERGQGMPDYDNLENLKEIFECTYSDLLEPKIEEDCTAVVSIADKIDDIKEDDMNLPIITKILSDPIDNEEGDANNGKKKFRFKEFFSKKKIRERISKTFGCEYEAVYNQKFLFKGLFKKRTKDDYENTLSQGMFRDKVNRNVIGVEAPWLYLRVFFFLLFCATIGFVISFINQTPIYGIIFGSLFTIIPLIMFLFESNFSRDISIFQVCKVFMGGGVMSLLLALILFQFLPANNVVVTVVVAPLVEEIAKFAVAVFFVSRLKPKSVLSGMLIGFAVGGGFAIFETCQYGLDYYFIGILETESNMGGMLEATGTTLLRTILSLASGHHYYTGFATAIYVLVKKSTKFSIKELFDWRVLLALLSSMLLHATWNGASFLGAWGLLLNLLVSLICLSLFLMLINVGIAETKVMAMYEFAKEKSDEEYEDDHNNDKNFEKEPIID